MENKLVAKIIPEMSESEKKLLMISSGFCLFPQMDNLNGENDHIPILSADWLEDRTTLAEEK